MFYDPNIINILELILEEIKGMDKYYPVAIEKKKRLITTNFYKMFIKDKAAGYSEKMNKIIFKDECGKKFPLSTEEVFQEAKDELENIINNAIKEYKQQNGILD